MLLPLKVVSGLDWIVADRNLSAEDGWTRCVLRVAESIESVFTSMKTLYINSLGARDCWSLQRDMTGHPAVQQVTVNSHGSAEIS